MANGWTRAGPRTRAIRAGIRRTSEQEHGEPIFTSSSFVFDSAEDAATKFSGDAAGNVYSRYTNPTVRGFEERLAALEQGEAAVATASGMSAIFALCMAHLKAGDHVLCSRDVFGATVGLFENTLQKFGVSVSFVPLTDIDQWRAAARNNTRLLFLEKRPLIPSMPLRIWRLWPRSVANWVHCWLSTTVFARQRFSNHCYWEADMVTHSATKYLDGQRRVLGGAVVGREELIAPIVAFNRSCGPTMSAFNAWIMLKGLETLDLRMRAHCDNAFALASWLQEQSWVEQVHYCGLPTHNGHALAARQQGGFGGVLAFEVRGGREAAWRFIYNTELMSLTPNLGDAKTTIVHPATTTHVRLAPEQRVAAGIQDGLIRIAVGLEDLEDLQADCERGRSALPLSSDSE